MSKQIVWGDLTKSPKSLFLLAIFLTLAIALAIWQLASSRSNQLVQGETAFDLEQIISDNNVQAFTDFTQKSGPQKTYELLKQHFTDNDPDAHDFAHIIGIVAHDSGGIANLKVCDTAYNYGCYHGFIEAFIAKNTVRAVSQIEDGCIALGDVHAPSCLHGIGHGVMVDASYRLDDALKNCSLLVTSSQIYCWDGVFMERIVASMLTGQNRPQMTAETLRQPCDSVKTIYREQCWRNQVSAWFRFFNGNTQNVGKQCSLIEQEYQKTCFESLGYLVTITFGQDAPKILAACSVGNNNTIADDCLVGTLKELLFEGRDPGLAQSLCDYVSGENRQNCLSTFQIHYQQSQIRFGQN